jgi:hypothetical protein
MMVRIPLQFRRKYDRTDGRLDRVAAFARSWAGGFQLVGPGLGLPAEGLTPVSNESSRNCRRVPSEVPREVAADLFVLRRETPASQALQGKSGESWIFTG